MFTVIALGIYFGFNSVIVYLMVRDGIRTRADIKMLVIAFFFAFVFLVGGLLLTLFICGIWVYLTRNMPEDEEEELYTAD